MRAYVTTTSYLYLLPLLLCLQPFLHPATAKCTQSRRPFAIALGNCTLPGTNVDSWGISSIEIGGVTTCLVPSMFVDNLFPMDTTLCDDGKRDTGETTRAQCESRRGGPLNTTEMGATFAPASYTDLAKDQNWVTLMGSSRITENIYGTAGKVELHLPSDIRLLQFPVGVINQGQDHNAGHLGLGPGSVFLKALEKVGMGPAFGFGLNVGSQSVSAPRNGHLVIDGMDTDSILGAWHNYTINHDPPDPRSRICPLQIVVAEMAVKFPNGTQSSDLLGTGPSQFNGVACIEPYDNYFRFPGAVFDHFSDIIGWTYKELSASDSLYIVEPGLLFPSEDAFGGSLVIKLDDGFTVEIPPEEMSHPLRGIDRSGKRVLQSNLTEITVFRSTDVLSKMAFGKAFLSQVYLAVDYKADTFRLATVDKSVTSPNPVPFGTNSTIECNGSGGMDGKAIGFTVAFSVLAVVLLAIVAAWFIRRRRRRNAPRPLVPPMQDVEPTLAENGNRRASYPEWGLPSPTEPRPAEVTPQSLRPLRTGGWGPTELPGERRLSELESPDAPRLSVHS